jgi:tRNA-splicing ligase RtcB
MPIEIFGHADSRSLEQLERCIQSAGEDLPGVLCADHHPGYAQPIGGVIGYRNHLSVSGVGYDIGCGNKAIQLPIRASELKKERAAIADLLWNNLSFGLGRANDENVDHPIIDYIARANFKPQRKLLQKARAQLGTIGGGNHYVDLFADEDDWVWLGVHFGSRGFGYQTAEGFHALHAGKRFMDRVPEGGMDAPPTLLKLGTELATDYIEAQELALGYAYAGRNWVCAKVCRLLGVTSPVMEIHNHHNYASKENHFGEDLWVVRKGATKANPGQLGFVGGSVKDISAIVSGIDSEKSQKALYSTIHGAGRLMGRKEAGGSYKWDKTWACLDYRKCDGTRPSGIARAANGAPPTCPKCGHTMARRKTRICVRPGKVDFAKAKKEIAAAGIELRGGNAEQTHDSYKNLADVLQCHVGTIRVEKILKPFIVCMADEKLAIDNPSRD